MCTLHIITAWFLNKQQENPKHIETFAVIFKILLPPLHIKTTITINLNYSSWTQESCW